MSQQQEPRTWAGFPGRYQNRPVLIASDLAWISRKRPTRCRYLLRISASFPDPAAFYSEVEFLAAVGPIDDCLAERLPGRLDGVKVGMIMMDRRRTWCLYVPHSPDIKAAVHSICPEISRFHPRILMEPDPHWHFYRKHLCPNVRQRRYIDDEQAVSRLVAKGERPGLVCTLRHRAAFPDSSSRDKFIQWCQRRECSIASVGARTEHGRRTYIARVDELGQLDVEDIWRRSSAIAAAAARVGGSYSGWTSPATQSTKQGWRM